MKKVLTILILISVQIYSQNVTTDPIILPQGYSLNLLNSKGTSGINNVVSNINFINPAALNEFNQITAGISYEYQTNINEAWSAGIGYKKITNFIPQSFGFIIPINNFRIGLSAGQTYKGNMDIGDIKITTMEQPEGTGQTFSPENITKIYTYSLITSFSTTDLFSNDNLSFGFKISNNRLNYFSRLDYLKVDVTTNTYNWAMGINYLLNLDEVRHVKLAISYSDYITFKKYFTPQYLNNDSLLVRGNIGYIGITVASFLLSGNVPANIQFDFEMNTSKQIIFLASLKDVFWSNLKSNIKDHFEFSGSMIYKLNNIVCPSLGFYSTGYSLKLNYFDVNKELNAFYITAGLQININPINIDLAFADSHFLSGEFRKQTIVKAGVEISL